MLFMNLYTHTYNLLPKKKKKKKKEAKMGVLKGEPAGDTSRLALRLEGKGVFWEAHADQQNN